MLTMLYLRIIDSYALLSIDIPSDSCLWYTKKKPSYPPNRKKQETKEKTPCLY